MYLLNVAIVLPIFFFEISESKYKQLNNISEQ